MKERTPVIMSTIAYAPVPSSAHAGILHRSRRDFLVAGVLGGIAETYGWNSNLLRMAFILSFLIPGPQAILYFFAWYFMPEA